MSMYSRKGGWCVLKTTSNLPPCDNGYIEGPLRVVSWETSPGVEREMTVCKLDCIAWAMRAYVLADAKFHKAEVKVQKKRSLKADADVAMGEATASGSKSVESLIDRKVSTAFKKIQKLHNARVKER
ncbi:hypothetical protein SERLA73DRAFT_157529, partial [Serpula lacrymans var. lacrymans S7.3]